MLLNEKELEGVLKYGIQPLLIKNDIQLEELSLRIKEKIYLVASFIYQDNKVSVRMKGQIECRNNQLCFKEVEGYIEYIFFKLSLLPTIKKMIQCELIDIEDNEIIMHYHVPIKSIQILNNQLDIEIAS